MWDLVVGDVVECVFQSPVSDWVHVTSASCFLGGLEDVDEGSLVSLPPGSTSDHDLAVEIVEASDEWLDLAYLVVLFDINFPEIGSVLLVEILLGLVSIAGDTLSHGDVSLEFVFLLDNINKIESFFEKMEGVHEEDWDLFEETKSGDKVGKNDVTSYQSIREYYLSTRVNSLLYGIHCLLLKMGKSLLFTLSLEKLCSCLIPWASRCAHHSWGSSHVHTTSNRLTLLSHGAECLLSNYSIASE